MKSEISKSFGTKAESKTAKKVAEEQGLSFQDDTKLYKMKMLKIKLI